MVFSKMDAVYGTINWVLFDNFVARPLWSQLYPTKRSVSDVPAAISVAHSATMAAAGRLGGRTALRVAGLSGAAAVVLGAYGAHKLSVVLDPERYRVFDTANRYHMLHSLALLGAPNCRHPLLVTSLLSVGMLLFSGSAYWYVWRDATGVRQLMPYGGMCLILGWLSMVL